MASTRVCLLALSEQLLAGSPPSLPRIVIKYPSDTSDTVYLKLTMQDIQALGPHVVQTPVGASTTGFIYMCADVLQAVYQLVVQVVQLGPSVYDDVAWPDNYYHNVGENLVAFYIKACLYLGHCDGTGVRLFLHHDFDSYSRLPFAMDKFKHFLDWGDSLPWFRPWIDCFTNEPIRHPNHTSFSNQVSSSLKQSLTS